MGTSPSIESTRHAETLRKAIENLINVKLHDALSRPGGLLRLAGHLNSGVASYAVRNAERQLEDTIEQVFAAADAHRGEPAAPRAPRRRSHGRAAQPRISEVA